MQGSDNLKKINFDKSQRKEYLKIAIALSIGATVWTVFKVIAQSQDPTELFSYWKIGYPISIVLSGIMGIIFPYRPWRWGICIIWVQFVMGLVTTRGDLNLLPPGIVFYALLTVPCIISGNIGSWLSGRWKIRNFQEDQAPHPPL